MSQIQVKREHNYSEEEMKQRVQDLADSLKDRFGGDYHWQGNRVHYAYKGLDAWVSFTDTEVDVEVKLGMLMSAMKGLIQREIETYLDEKLA